MKGMARKHLMAGQSVFVQGWGRGTVVTDSDGRNAVNVRGQNWAHLGGAMSFPLEWVDPVCPGCNQRRAVKEMSDDGYCNSCRARDAYEMAGGL